MPAPIDNKHAQRYDPVKEIKQLLKMTKENEEILYIGTLLESKPYVLRTIEHWAEKSEFVSQTITKIKEICKSRLIGKGLYKETSEGMTKFVLINNHGMKEKSEVDSNVKVEEIPPIQIQFVNKK